MVVKFDKKTKFEEANTEEHYIREEIHKTRQDSESTKIHKHVSPCYQ